MFREDRHYEWRHYGDATIRVKTLELIKKAIAKQVNTVGSLKVFRC